MSLEALVVNMKQELRVTASRLGLPGTRRTLFWRSCSSTARTGSHVTKDQTYADVESVKAVSELYALLSGEVVEVNAESGDAPTAVNEYPSGKGWLVKVRPSDQSEADSLTERDKRATGSVLRCAGPDARFADSVWSNRRPRIDTLRRRSG